VAYRSEAFEPARHELSALCSGEPELDLWLREHAAGAEARRVARTFVWVSTDVDPDHAHQGRGVGGALLADALGRVVVAAQTVAARFVVVGALHEQAAMFCEHHGFRRIPGTLRLLANVSDIAASVDHR
jgi:GNAT superfamily N-acetyltransferase